MRLFLHTIFIVLLTVVAVQAYNGDQDRRCETEAANHFPKDEVAMQVAFFQCMAKYWRTLSNNNHCPHTKVSCLCYNGCVKDRSDWIPDVGGWCTDACGQSR
ncbi:hypothetical protein V8E36_006823 [Tilletia maclaganii]